MWIFTPHGVISVVEPERTGMADPPLVIRARSRATIEWVRTEFAPGGPPPEIDVWPNRDYPYRIWVARDLFRRLMDTWVAGLHYPNFKAASDPDLQDLYHDVWQRVAEEYVAERPAVVL